MKFIKIIGILSAVIILVVFILNYPKLKLISGFAAKNMASSYFLANRSVQNINAVDNNGPLIKLAKTNVDNSKGAAVSTVFGLSKKTAYYREGVGAVLVDNDLSNLSNINLKIPNRNFTAVNKPYPYGNLEPVDTVFANVDYNNLDDLTNQCFKESNADYVKNTRSILVLYKGKIISEKYAEGFDKNSLLQGWSMTKSLLTTCFGILEREREYDIHKPIQSFPSWLNDERKNITTNHLLRMESGLAWEEDYGKICDVTKMLFDDKDVTTRAINKPAKHKPEKVFNYASGTTNILSAILKKQLNTEQEYLDFPYQKLVDKIRMHSMVIETDLRNNYVGSSYSWATTRDWGKFGQLMLDKGHWNGEQLFNPSWIKYISSPNKTSNNEYGAQWWLNRGNFMPNVPKDCFYADGYQGQRIFIIPSKELVIVRFGVTQLDREGLYPLFNQLIGDICNTIK
ncbi:serine hydrolase domain-containing protein [Wenyingzhuangia sp. IMCC45533]